MRNSKVGIMVRFAVFVATLAQRVGHAVPVSGVIGRGVKFLRAR